ncbi:leucyl/phenylalanyl-tRNA--protein transferase [Candidatus Thiothrix sp. Deng01]|uniref:Leucyl/phenylalanyl-tRNA--protein transferase n=1 Tax=Candidatus Thiothrix phosphatis TaxID=3112415 RepID=A0ABU6CTY8_9GAMM|nr:leucyl/phenylalanyl-tRNA--protein transferase [Candidatus Thiothrix sp. Deng01]MEB4590289.1 leucyl/phenylalanyl-tRNA--protein transferase [Candidatus Thiothrix sp. Deng01]
MLPRSLSLTLLNADWPDEPFPPVELAWEEPNGLLAVGGDLSMKRLQNAYRVGVFPWFGPREPIYWWTPDPRTVLFPHKIRITRSLRKSLRNKGYRITFDTCFAEVVDACAAPRAYTAETWITHEMHTAYCRLHAADVAHSVEVWNPAGELVGGLYGVATGGVFSGESMFSREPDTSKIAMVALAWHVQHWGFKLIDCQIENPHLLSMGAENISRAAYIRILQANLHLPPPPRWETDPTANLSHWNPGQTT